MMPDLMKIRHLVLDMDGTIYLGRTLFPQTLPFLGLMSRLGIGCSFVTNNCSRSRAESAARSRRHALTGTSNGNGDDNRRDNTGQHQPSEGGQTSDGEAPEVRRVFHLQ